MANDVLGVSVNDNFTRQKTTITVTVREATGPGGAAIFFGVDTQGGAAGVGASGSILPNQLLMQGAFEKGFVETPVDAAQGVTGHITVDPPLPVQVAVQLLGESLYILPPNTPSGDFFLTPAQEKARL